MEFVELEAREFEKWTKSCPVKDFLQSVEMYKRYQAKGQEVYLLGVKESGEILAAGLVTRMSRVLGWKIFNCARGPVMNYNQMRAREILAAWTQGVKKFLKRKKGMVLLVSPAVRRKQDDGIYGSEYEKTEESLEKLKYKNLGEYAQVKWIYTLDPRGKTAEELLKGWRKGHRLSIRYATQRYGMKLKELKPGEFGVLKELVDEAGERHEFRAVSEEYFEEMAKAFGEKVCMMVAEMKDPQTGKKVATAGAMFVTSGDEIVYLFSGSRNKYKKYGGPHLIQWEMIQRAIKQGLKYNFYGTKPVAEDGVHNFKTGFHGEVEEYVGTFGLALGWLGKLYLRRKKYQKYGEVA